VADPSAGQAGSRASLSRSTAPPPGGAEASSVGHDAGRRAPGSVSAGAAAAVTLGARGSEAGPVRWPGGAQHGRVTGTARAPNPSRTLSAVRRTARDASATSFCRGTHCEEEARVFEI